MLTFSTEIVAITARSNGGETTALVRCRARGAGRAWANSPTVMGLRQGAELARRPKIEVRYKGGGDGPSPADEGLRADNGYSQRALRD